MNLLKETLNIMSTINKTTDDVAYVKHAKKIYKNVWDTEEEGVPIVTTDWDGFIKFAKHFANYDNGYGGNEVPRNTFIIFKDNSWLQRWEYDGSEGWEYMKCPAK